MAERKGRQLTEQAEGKAGRHCKEPRVVRDTF